MYIESFQNIKYVSLNLYILTSYSFQSDYYCQIVMDVFY